MSADRRTPYDSRPSDDPLVQEASEVCPWGGTDHRSNPASYCTWCEGYVTGVLAQIEKGMEA